jgi:UDP-N-acetyl-D-glucosamine dehydrogenase
MSLSTHPDLTGMSNRSIHPLSGVEYAVPLSVDDIDALQVFRSRHIEKPVVVVQGLGFVGAVMSLVCANALGVEYAVIGVDLATSGSWWRVASLRQGIFPLAATDPKISELFESAKAKRNFLATADPNAYALADVIIVDVNLDVAKANAPDGELSGFGVELRDFTTAIRTIGAYCRPDVLVLIETTVPPGTCEKVVLPTLRAALAARGLPSDQLRVGHSYERVMPGPEYVDSIRTFPRVYAGVDAASAEATERFLRTIIDTETCPLTRLHATTASEMAKVLENSYRAMNIAFMVEWSRFAEEAGVDIYAIVQAIRVRPTHANLMFPGIGVGGYCLTKDPLLASWSRQKLFGGEEPLTVSEQAVSINDRMPRFAFEFLARQVPDLAGQRVLLLGLSYRGDVGDTRFSPVGPFYEFLIGAGAEVLLHDPIVPYWMEKNRSVAADAAALLAKVPSVIVASAGHRAYRDQAFIDLLLTAAPAVILDTIGLWSEHQLERLATQHTVKVLGRGDR